DMQSRFSPLDALRAIAAILVVWQHFAETFIKIPGVASQGTAMGRAGRVHIERDAAGTIWVGGASVTCISGQVVL
ncbi:MAG: hypothetical protein U1C86_23420, partial [Hydrogenophaga sp.]|nr:hypothetical protein [Hydrogenophaga sp.]